MASLRTLLCIVLCALSCALAQQTRADSIAVEGESAVARSFGGSGCLANTSFRSQVERFLVNASTNEYWAKLADKDKLPSASKLFRYACAQVEYNPSYDPSDDDDDYLTWLLLFLDYNFWETEEGNPPFTTEYPFSWKFLDDRSVYRVTDAGLVYTGSAAIQRNQLGIGRSSLPPISGCGFYISKIVLNRVFASDPNVRETRNGERVRSVYSRVHKTLVNIDFVGQVPGTTSHPLLYTMESTYALSKTYPLIRIRDKNETYNSLATVELFGACGFACVNCPPGGVCDPGVTLTTRGERSVPSNAHLDQPAREFLASLETERDRLMNLKTSGVPLPLLANAHIQKLATEYAQDHPTRR